MSGNDFSDDQDRREMAQAIAQVAETLDDSYPLLLAGERRTLPETFTTTSPSDPDVAVATYPRAGATEAEVALDTAVAALDGWRNAPAAERAATLARVAETLEYRRFEFAARLCFEAGHTWTEADVEVGLAINACRQAADPDRPARGPAVIITPFASPLHAVACDGAAALLAGDPIIVKPSCLTPLAAWKFVEALHDAGVPQGAAQLLTGEGRDVGAALARHAATCTVAFSGRPATAELLRATNTHVNATVGGCDAVLVDRTANVDKAAERLARGAFWHAGQYLFACSRAFVHVDVYEALVEALVERAAALRVGPSIDYGTEMGPLIDAAAAEAVMSLGAAALPELGPTFAAPTVLTDTDLGREEILGPIILLIRVRDLVTGRAAATALGARSVSTIA